MCTDIPSIVHGVTTSKRCGPASRRIIQNSAECVSPRQLRPLLKERVEYRRVTNVLRGTLQIKSNSMEIPSRLPPRGRMEKIFWIWYPQHLKIDRML